MAFGDDWISRRCAVYATKKCIKENTKTAGERTSPSASRNQYRDFCLRSSLTSEIDADQFSLARFIWIHDMRSA
jgi:hypothetical protein